MISRESKPKNFEHLSRSESGSVSIWSNFSNRLAEIELDVIGRDFESVFGNDTEFVCIFGGGKNLFLVKGESVVMLDKFRSLDSGSLACGRFVGVVEKVKLDTLGSQRKNRHLFFGQQ